MVLVRNVLCVTALSCLLSQPSYAHAVIDEGTAVAGRFSFITLRITHGCGTSPTREVRMRIPEGVTRVSPEYSESWRVEKTLRELAEPYENEAGELVTETVDEIIWRGGLLPDGYFGVFRIRALIPDLPGTVLWFKTVQHCDEGTIAWREVPESDDQNPYELNEPAPFLHVVDSD